MKFKIYKRSVLIKNILIGVFFTGFIWWISSKPKVSASVFLPSIPVRKVACSEVFGKTRSYQINSPKIIDYILVNTELDMLEVRTRSLASVVDIFVIAESPTSFTNISKKLHFKEALELGQFDYLKNKLEHVVFENNYSNDTNWDRERRMRRESIQIAIKRLSLTPKRINEGLQFTVNLCRGYNFNYGYGRDTSYRNSSSIERL
jgi:hypothetical protein